MKKTFLDYLYEERAKIQTEIDNYKKAAGETMRIQCCPNMPKDNSYTTIVEHKRKHIQFVNKTIEEYLNQHQNGN